MSSETGRIEAFSDGVFSIAATLLVLELKPPAAGQPFWSGVLAMWPGYLSFLLSFLFIGIMWINHHRLFSHIRRADDALMLANLLLLLGVVWIPYPTSLIAQSVSNGHLREAAIFYNASYLALALLYCLLLYTCLKHKLVDPKYGSIESLTRRFSIGPIGYGLCFALTWVSVPWSLALNAGLSLFFLCAPQPGHEAGSAG